MACLGSAGPAFAHGCHDLGKLGVESVKLLSFGSARGEGVPIAGCAPAPDTLHGARRGDVRQRVTGHEDQVRALPGGDTSSVGEAEYSCRFSRGSGQGLCRADPAPYEEFELPVQACSEHGPRVRSIRARQQSNPRIGQSSHVVLGPREGRHLPAMRSRNIRSQPACPGVAECFSEPWVPCNCRATRFAESVLDGGQRRTDHDSGFGHSFDQGLVQLGVRRDVGHHIDTGGHDLLDTGRRAHVSDDDQAAGVRGNDQCLDGFGVQRGP